MYRVFTILAAVVDPPQVDSGDRAAWPAAFGEQQGHAVGQPGEVHDKPSQKRGNDGPDFARSDVEDSQGSHVVVFALRDEPNALPSRRPGGLNHCATRTGEVECDRRFAAIDEDLDHFPGFELCENSIPLRGPVNRLRDTAGFGDRSSRGPDGSAELTDN